MGADLPGLFRVEDARMMSLSGSWSGAIIGGLIFGAGIILARGCSGRLLVLAGGCTIGNGLTGGSILVATAWVALFSMWISAVVTNYLVDQRGVSVAA